LFRNWFRKNPLPLTGAPAVRRVKSFSAQSGYVYQYVFEGRRDAAGDPSTEFVFATCADRKSWHPISVLVEQPAVRAWEARHRALSSTEWYALAKMALFAAFDERGTPAELRGAPVRVREADIEGIIELLGIG